MANKMTVQQIAEHFGVTKTAVYLWLKQGLPYEKEKVIGIKERKIIDLEQAKKFLKQK